LPSVSQSPAHGGATVAVGENVAVSFAVAVGVGLLVGTMVPVAVGV